MLGPGATIAPSQREWSSPYRLAMGRPISINTATVDQLVSIPNIGPKRAGEIVRDRRSNGRFSGIVDLKRVRGVGPRTVQKVTPFIVP